MGNIQVLGAAVAVCSTIANFAHADCQTFAQVGIYDTYLSTSDIDRASSFRHWFCQSQFSSSDSARKTGIDIGIDDFDFGFDSDAQSWSEFRYEYCSDEGYTASYSEDTVNFVQKVNESVVAAFAACIGRPGLHAWIEQGSGPHDFRFQTIFRPISKDDKWPTVEFFQVKGAECDGRLVDGFEIGPDGTQMLCSRVSNGPVDIGFDATALITPDTPLSLPEIMLPPKPAPSIPISWQAVHFVEQENVAAASGVVSIYGDGVILNAAPYKSQPNSVTYSVDSSFSGEFELSIEYAAAAARPVEVLLNGELAIGAALTEGTGCWFLSCQVWRPQGILNLKKGVNRITLRRSDVFPHIRAFRLDPVGSVSVSDWGGELARMGFSAVDK